METGDIFVTLHVDVNQVSFTKVVHAVFKEIILNKTLLHGHAILCFHVVISVVGEVIFFFAELNGFSDS